MLKRFTVVIPLLFLAACATTPGISLVRDNPKTVNVEQAGKLDPQHPDAFVFCNAGGGAWGCKPISHLTPVSDSFKQAKLAPHQNSSSEEQSSGKYGSSYQGSANFACAIGEKNCKALKNQSKKKITYSFIGRVHFDFDRYYLDQRAQRKLMAFLPKAKGHEVKLLGFTDDVGAEKYNNLLATERASTVEKFFVQQGRLLRKDFLAVGKGLCCYLVKNGTDAQRRKNRRVEIYVSK